MGTVQRATNTPATIPTEMMKGENPAVTSLVGASAAPSQAPAPKPQETPSQCSMRAERRVGEPGALPIALPHCRQQADAYGQSDPRRPEMAIGENCLPQRLFQGDLLRSTATLAALAARRSYVVIDRKSTRLNSSHLVISYA